jgi:TatD DNase family protein
VLVDTHAHIQMRQFDSDRESVIAVAEAAGVWRIIVPGTDVPTSRAAVDLAARYPGRVFAAVGTHPHDAATLDTAALETQRELARRPGVVAIGEIGLDYYRDLAPHETQRAALITQLELARALNLPVILHNRESHADLVGLLREHGAGVRGVFHCFIGDQTMAREALDRGFWLSFAGPVTYPRNTDLAEVAAWAPLDRILLETESPYLAPQPVRGRRNEPRYVEMTARRVAELRGMPFEDLVAATTRNAAELFTLPMAPREEEPECASLTP